MPTYDYRCTACARVVEVMHGINDSGPATCEHCGGAMRKALSPPAIHFKGSGWAKKDAASARKTKSAAGSSSDTATTKADDKTSSSDSTSPATTDSGTKSGETKGTPAPTTGSKTD
jgi:putative FmdB family regulatory protein